jgi:serine/threonine-protein kinase
MVEAPSSLREALADRYTIDEEIGRGGMATVYGASDLRHGRRVAIKVLRSELSANLGTERFLREIGIAARLTHPHIVPLLDSGMADGMLYYVAQYVAGGSLRQRLKEKGALPIREALRIAEEVYNDDPSSLGIHELSILNKAYNASRNNSSGISGIHILRAE